MVGGERLADRIGEPMESGKRSDNPPQPAPAGAAGEPAPAQPAPSEAGAGPAPRANAASAESSPAAETPESAATGASEPPIFGGRNPSVPDWFSSRVPEPEEPEEEPGPEQEEELQLLPDAKRREAMVQELFSPFAVFLFFVFSLLLGLATVNVSIPASATVRASVQYVNYRALSGQELIDFQREQDRLLRSPETRSLIIPALRPMPGGDLPSFANDDLQFHHRLERSWSPEGRFMVSLASTDPQWDARRLSLLMRAMVTISSRSLLRIEAARAEIARLQTERTELEAESARLRVQIEALAPEALKQSPLAEATLAMHQYLSLLEPDAPQRVAAEQNLQRLQAEAQKAREVGEERDALIAQRMEAQHRIDLAGREIHQQEELIGRVVYPEPLRPADVGITDLRPARYNLLWIVTLGISAVFVGLLALSFVRQARRGLLERTPAPAKP